MNGVIVFKDVVKFYYSVIYFFFNEDMSSVFRDMIDLYLFVILGDS